MIVISVIAQKCILSYGNNFTTECHFQMAVTVLKKNSD